ncbi:unnamed protein product [Lactuca saligna]|uniref:Uncharacterized protein n=1 Tax=Lactuca saligna TaxID=75948 RepID=A0AA36E7N2_LACSI|nr:unnamed protein product [Lactuca saligna]
MTTSPLTISIPISSIPLLPKMSSVETCLPQIAIPLSSLVFSDSTIPSTSTVTTPPEVPIIKSVSELNEKLNSIVEHSNALSSIKWENLLTTHMETVEMLTSTNANVLEETTKTAQASKKKITEAKKKVNKLIHEVQEFMTDFRTSSDKSVADVNKVIEGFQTSLQSKKEALSSLRFRIQRDNDCLCTSFSERILRLQNDLDVVNKIMDALAEQDLGCYKKILRMHQSILQSINKKRFWFKGANLKSTKD